MRILVAGLLVTAGLASAMMAQPLAAQQTGTRRQGFWFSGGLGYGSAVLTCGDCGKSQREDGVSGFLALGGTPNPQLLIGVESDGWSKSKEGLTVTMGTLTFVARWYPTATGGFFVKGGAGLAGWHASGFNSTESHTGYGMLGGVGVDIPISAKVSITPTLSYSAGWLGTIDGLAGVHQNVIQISAGATIP